MNNPGAILGTHEITHHNPVGITVRWPGIRQESLVSKSLKGRTLDMPQQDRARLDLGIFGSLVTGKIRCYTILGQEHQLIRGRVGVGTAHHCVGNVSAHRKAGVGR